MGLAEDKEWVAKIADAARLFLKTYDEFDGDPYATGEDLSALLDACEVPDAYEELPAEETEEEVEACFRKNWQHLIDPDGTINSRQIKRELFDYAFLLDQIPKVYCEITGGLLSKPNYPADVVIAQFHEYTEKWNQQAIADYIEDQKAELAECTATPRPE